jgi:glycosyltransferase involved in cell wall biosynthesis
MPKVSLICGFYNRPNLVHRTLVGLANQSCRDVEFYIFDDGSSDSTASVIEKELIRIGDDRFKFTRLERNGGLTKGLIAAVKATDSEYVAIHDAGDYSLATRISKQTAALDAQKDRVVVGSHYVNYIEDTGISRLRTPSSDDATLATLLIDPTFTHGEVMFKRAAYEAAGGYRSQFRYSQDNDLWLRMIEQGRFYTVPEVLYIRCVLLSGISYNSSSLGKQSAYYILGKKIASGEISAAILNRLDEGADIFEILSRSSPDVQKVIVRAAVRAIAFGASGSAKSTLPLLQTSVKKSAIRILASITDNSVGSKGVKSAWRLLASDSGINHIQDMQQVTGEHVRPTAW